MDNKSKGFVVIDRAIEDHWLWSEKPFSKGQAWIDLIMMVNWKDNKALVDGELMNIQRGQRLTSEVKLAERWGWSRWKVRKYLETLQSDCMITIEKKTGKYTLVTIANYALWQDRQSETDSKPTAERQQTDSSQTADQQLTDTNNKENKDIQEIQDINTLSSTLDDSYDETQTDDVATATEGRIDDIVKPSKSDIPYREIVEYLNEICNKQFKWTSKAAKDKIKARWAEGYRLEDFKKVVLNKSRDWLNSVDYNKYLRPETLFGTKFEGYLNESQITTKGGVSSAGYTTADGFNPGNQTTTYGTNYGSDRLAAIKREYAQRAADAEADAQRVAGSDA